MQDWEFMVGVSRPLARAYVLIRDAGNDRRCSGWTLARRCATIPGKRPERLFGALAKQKAAAGGADVVDAKEISVRRRRPRGRACGQGSNRELADPAAAD